MTHARPISLPVARSSQPPAWLAGAPRLPGVATPAWAATATVEDPSAVRERIERERHEVLARAEAEGRALGAAAAGEQHQQTLARLERVLADLGEARRAVLASMEHQMIDLALCVAGCVLERELTADRDGLLRMIREAVNLVAAKDEVEISVSPADYQWLVPRLREIQPTVDARLLIKADPNVGAGCLVETRLATVDATITARLRNIADALEAR